MSSTLTYRLWLNTVNSIDDFCFFAPQKPGAQSAIGNTEREEVSWCVQAGYGTRVIPPGTITGAHFVQTPDYVQVTGVGDLTKVNIPQGDTGGELDPHGADGNGRLFVSCHVRLDILTNSWNDIGNPIGGLVFSTAFGGGPQQIHEWTVSRDFTYAAAYMRRVQL